MSKRFTSTIAGASILITTVGLLSKGFGFFREVVYANSYGLETNFDIYLIGAAIPLIINTAVFFLAQNYFIPVYHKENNNISKKSTDFINSSFWLFLISSIAFTLLLYLFTPLIINTYLPSAENELKELASKIFTIFLLTIPFNAVYSILTAFLQAEFDFKNPAISALFQNIFIIILVYFFDNVLSVYAIPIGYLIGSIIQFIYLYIIASRKDNFIVKKFTLKTSKSWLTNNLFIFIVLIEIINQLYVLIDRYFYGRVEQGGIASLNYSSVLFGLPIAIFSLALSTAIFPQFTKAFNNKDNETLEGHFIKGISMNLLVFIPIAFIFIYYGDNLIKLMYERGKFTDSDTLMTYKILRIYAFSLIFYASYAIVNKLIYGAGLVKQLLIITAGVFALKVILNFYLVGSYQQEGLAGSTTASYISLSIIGYILVVFKLKFKSTGKFFLNIIFYSLNSLIALLISEMMISLFLLDGLYGFLISIIIFSLVYMVNLYLIKPSEYLIINEVIKRR
ncbi:MAG: lipid II flippase MurJ [Ignavibacteriaceae bacterium]